MLCVLSLVLLPIGLVVGGVQFSVHDVFKVLCGNYGGQNAEIAHFIIIESRLPALITAFLGCAALSVAGLIMQTCFNNPLAGPSIMGISSGASLGAALVIMLMSGIISTWGNIAIIIGATVGAMIILGIIVLFSGIVKTSEVLLIVGILIGYLTNSVISLLNFFSSDSAVHSFVIWGLGTFSAVGTDKLAIFCTLSILMILSSMLYAKSLNAMLFGERFAQNVGVSTAKTRTALLFIAGALTAVVTAWCGPIGFIGLVVPHISRLIMASSNHRILLPATALCGGLIGLVCQIVSVCPTFSTGATIPINAITPFIGVPVILYVLIHRKKLLYFN
ncbi:MAG: iron ABC transporter permease [Muribaculaceae bacterium]|nr:iron ABC transporter permease [Muribaculaceae bacterium]